MKTTFKALYCLEKAFLEKDIVATIYLHPCGIKKGFGYTLHSHSLLKISAAFVVEFIFHKAPG